MDDLEQAIGRDAMAKVRAAGWTPPPPKPEPKRLVAMEESRERDGILTPRLRDLNGNLYEYADWDNMTLAELREYNAADNWLVRTVNRRIIEGLPQKDRWATLRLPTSKDGIAHYWSPVYVPHLLSAFCGEEAP